MAEGVQNTHLATAVPSSTAHTIPPPLASLSTQGFCLRFQPPCGERYTTSRTSPEHAGIVRVEPTCEVHPAGAAAGGSLHADAHHLHAPHRVRVEREAPCGPDTAPPYVKSVSRLQRVSLARGTESTTRGVTTARAHRAGPGPESAARDASPAVAPARRTAGPSPIEVCPCAHPPLPPPPLSRSRCPPFCSLVREAIDGVRKRAIGGVVSARQPAVWTSCVCF
jgi:hypothetical protein